MQIGTVTEYKETCLLCTVYIKAANRGRSLLSTRDLSILLSLLVTVSFGGQLPQNNSEEHDMSQRIKYLNSTIGGL